MKKETNGIILINKPKDFTSRDVVNIVSKKLKTKKVGHTGTLDPIASGVLVICIGKATKLCELLTSEKKEYIAGGVFGYETDSLDITGNILKKDNKKIQKQELDKVLKSFITTYNQEVPIYSAVKVNGKKLYEYARENIKVDLPKKEVTVYDISLLEYSENKFTFKCTVSKGTYIRSLIRDIAYKLNTYATMTDLIRTRQGKFKIEYASNIDSEYNIIKIQDALDIEKKQVDDNLKFKIINGQKLNSTGLILYLDKNDNELAIYKDGKMFKMLYTEN